MTDCRQSRAGSSLWSPHSGGLVGRTGRRLCVDSPTLRSAPAVARARFQLPPSCSATSRLSPWDCGCGLGRHRRDGAAERSPSRDTSRAGRRTQMDRLNEKVALVTGAARGQGRSHAVRLAEEGADIIAVDLCAQVGSVPYPMATPEDLANTVKEVEALDRRIVAARADVRDYAGLKQALDRKSGVEGK